MVGTKRHSTVRLVPGVCATALTLAFMTLASQRASAQSWSPKWDGPGAVRNGAPGYWEVSAGGAVRAMVVLYDRERNAPGRPILLGLSFAGSLTVDPVTKQQVPAAIVTLRMIIDQFPDAPQTIPARNRLAMMLMDMNKYADAADVLEELGKHGDNPMDVWFRLGEIYERRLNDMAKARDSYAKVPPGSPRYADAQKKLRSR